ncbi:FMN-linked oxidoreductase [Whalleya microplaca]|nr:FMN-linked oxidoreductase [Whalleya microplaca]
MASSTAPKAKLHGRAFYESLGSPKYVLAPMVDQSEFAWRMLTRSFLTPAENAKLLAYTPMFHARLFKDTPKYRDTHFEATKPDPTTSSADKPDPDSNPEQPAQPIPFLDGNPAFDRPLFVQFCANDPEHLLSAARLAAPYCDAIDLNLGCPQGIARRGHYGAFLQEDQTLVYELIHTLHEQLPIPVTAKIRILETKEATLAYARTVLAAGASILTVHGRRREQKAHLTGVADWTYVRYLRDNLPRDTVIFANGNVLRHADLERCLAATGADAVMSAEGNLSDPAIFARPPPPGHEGREYWRGGRDGRGGYRVDAVFRRYMDIIHEHVLRQAPPARRPLFVVGDDESWIHADGAGRSSGGVQQEGREEEQEREEDGPARKKRKKDGGGARLEKATSPNLVAMRPHLFNLLRHLGAKHTDIRDALARSVAGDVPAIEKVLEMVERRVAEGLVEYEKTDGKSVEEPEPEPPAEAPGGAENTEDPDYIDPESSVAAVKACKRPWWIVQPIVRPLPKEALANGSITLSKKDRKKQAAEAANNGPIVEANEKESSNGKPAKVEDELPKADGIESIKEPAMDTKAQGLTSEELVCG